MPHSLLSLFDNIDIRYEERLLMSAEIQRTKGAELPGTPLT